MKCSFNFHSFLFYFHLNKKTTLSFTTLTLVPTPVLPSSISVSSVATTVLLSITSVVLSSISVLFWNPSSFFELSGDMNGYPVSHQCGTLKNLTVKWPQEPSIGQNWQFFNGINDISIWVKNFRVCVNNKQKKKLHGTIRM